jgi:alpha-galactosidase
MNGIRTMALVLASAAAGTGSTRAAEPIETPFSFTYDARAADLSHWQRGETETTDAPGLARPGSQLDRLAQTWTDPATGLRVAMASARYPDGAREWVLSLENTGRADTPLIEEIQALHLVVPLPGGPSIVHHSLGDRNSADSFRPLADALEPSAELKFAPVGGRSSDGHMPYFNLQHEAGGLALAIGWSGQWAASFRREGERVRIRMGMEHTRLVLRPGERIRTPRILAVDYRGPDARTGQQRLRRTLFGHCTPRRQGDVVFPPICGSVGEVDPDGSYEGPHIRVMKPLAANGVEVFWSDMDPQQWYPGGFPNGTGTWEPDPVKYPRGLKPVGEAARAAGLGYLLWFEPERVAAGTEIARDHPEWVAGGAKGGLFRLDLPEARRWITEKIDRQITLAGLQWVRWDFNMPPLASWRSCDAPDRQGMTEIRHIEGLYAMWDELARRHPGLLMDICASGGRRLDIEMLSRGLPLWHSDLQCEGAHPEADQLQNAGLYRWIPLHGCGVFGLEPSYAFRSAATAGNILALAAYAPENADGVKRSVAIQKRLRPLALGDFYDTLPHTADLDKWFAYQFHRADLDAGFLIAFRRAKCADAAVRLAVRGARPDGAYVVTDVDTGEKRPVTGAALGALSVSVREAPGSALLIYEPATPTGSNPEDTIKPIRARDAAGSVTVASSPSCGPTTIGWKSSPTKAGPRRNPSSPAG